MKRSQEPQTRGFASSGEANTRRSDDDERAAEQEIRHEIRYSDELKRKALHLLALIIPLGIWPIGRTAAVIVLGALAAVALTADFLRARSRRFSAAIYRYFQFMMRPEECPPVGGPIVLNGATWVILSATLLVAIFPLEIAISSFTAFMIADAAAAIVGRGVGRRRWRHTSRTVEGSSAFLLTGLTVMLLFGWTPLWISFLAVLAGTAAEIPSGPLNDNIRVPLVIAIVIYALQYLSA